MDSIPCDPLEDGATVRELRKRVAQLEAENERLTNQLIYARATLTGTTTRVAASPGRTSDRIQRPASSPHFRPSTLSRTSDLAGPVSDVANLIAQTPGPGEELCDNCGKVVPTASASMHRLHCMRNTTRCPACGLAMGAKDLAQHTSSFEGGPARACAAAAAGDIALLEAMRVHGANLRASCDSGDSPIHAAARVGQTSALDFLLAQGVSINTPNTLGETPLHLACARWRAGDPPSPEPARFVRLLLDRGCDADARTLLGDTPMQTAQRRAFNDAVLLLATVGGALRPSSRDGRQRPASAGSLKRLNSAPGLVLSPTRSSSRKGDVDDRPQSDAPVAAYQPTSGSGGSSKPPSIARRVHPTNRGTPSPSSATHGGASATLGIAFVGSTASVTSPPQVVVDTLLGDSL